ncbi:MAG TPA: ACP S-malonyltransferase [Candidatus Elarobacter sp.]|nr:ACP S-malonyltransferase [Candidatus Elarobacter sp.]
MNVILLFPGQGSQKPGMGKDLAAAFPAARDVFARIDDALGVALSTLCFEGPADELTATKNAQPALFAHGAAAWAVVRDALAPHVVAAAGHSLGELTAHHAANSFALDAGARLVHQRGQAMFDIGSERPGTMAAILGALSTPIDTICDRATTEAGLVVPANYNTAEQTVVSGEIAGVERAMALAKEAGAKRAVRLSVSGAFHSPLMRPAEIVFSSAIGRVEFTNPVFPVYSNVTQAPVTTAAVARDVLLRQLTSPVRWMGEVRAMADAFPDALYVELGPGNVLSGLVSRIVPGARTMTCGTAQDVDALMTTLATQV